MVIGHFQEKPSSLQLIGYNTVLWSVTRGAGQIEIEAHPDCGRFYVMSVQVELSRIFIREMSDLQFIELKEADGDRTFPIAIGLPEAMAIERRLKGIQPQRPQTHDLLAQIIESFGATVEGIEITDLDENTFYAKIRIKGPGDRSTEIDSRPSDAIALGSAMGIPIFVAESVIEDASASQNTLGPPEDML